MFDMHVTNRGICGPAGPVEVQLVCGQCRAQQPAQVSNSRWNTLTCSNCRATARQYVRVSPATVDPLGGRVGSVSVQPGFFDWKKLGEWAAFLGPREERRAPLCFQFVQQGLSGRTFHFRFSARRTDDRRVVFEQETVWK